MYKILFLSFIPFVEGSGSWCFKYLIARLLYPLLPFLTSALFFYPHYTLDQSLDTVEGIIEHYPDSALHALQVMKLPSLPDNKTYARYCLLLTQALYKNHTPPTNDSLINIAYRYFESGDDSLLKARSCFYYGRFYEQQQQKETACRFYYDALRAAEHTEDLKLQGQIHYCLGRINLFNNLTSQALYEYQASIPYFNKLPSKDALCYSFMALGSTYLYTNKEDSAFIYYDKAIALCREENNNELLNKVFTAMSSTYRKKGKFELALQTIDQAIEEMPDTNDLRKFYLIKGNTYFQMQRYDSAKHYLSLSACSNDIYVKSGSYYQLYKLSQTLQQWEDVNRYINLYWAGRNKIESLTKTKEIVEVQAKYDKQELELKNSRLELIRNRIAAVLGIVIPSFFYLLFYFLRKRRNDTLTMDRERVMLLNVLFTKRDEIIQKEEEIKRLTSSHRQLAVKMIWSTAACQKIKRIEYNRLHFIPASRDEQILTEEDWSELMGCLDAVTGNGLTSFIETQTKLSKEDIRYCCLWKIQVKTVDIATIFQVNENSVNKRKSRIRQKLVGKYADGHFPEDLSLLF